ncbi:MAG TPA: molybdopterin converting factor subunit 1 [Burkholderiales bacterium]|nr:molybdopterin converting factor subunit 1 [Burkholderiales bacterium]
MKVRVLFFASLREQLGAGSLELELPAGVATVGALRAHLRGRGAAYESALGEKKALRAALNQEMVPGSAALRPGDEVAFFPPVTGG